MHDVNPGCEEKINNLKEQLTTLSDEHKSDHDTLISLQEKYANVHIMSSGTRDNIEKIKENLGEIASKTDLDKVKATVSDLVAIQNSTVNKLVEITKNQDNSSLFKNDIFKTVLSALIIAIILFILSQAFSNLFKKEVDLNDNIKIHKTEKSETKDIFYDPRWESGKSSPYNR